MKFLLALVVPILAVQTVKAENPVAIKVQVKFSHAMPNAAKPAAAETQPADALKPSVGPDDAPAGKQEVNQPGPKKDDSKPADLETIAAPLRALFGGIMEIDAEDGVILNLQAGNAPAENEALIQEFVRQYRPILKTELAFVRLMCGHLKMDQRAKVRVPAEAALKQAAKNMVSQQHRMERGIAVPESGAEPHKFIREAVEKSLKEILDADQMTRFSQAAAGRIETRKRAAILSIVSRLDGQLFLTSAQRENITEAISKSWQSKWEGWLTINVYGDQYFPQIPEQCVAPHLNPEQKKVWQGLQKIDFQGWWGNDADFQMLDNEGWWGDVPDKEDVIQNGAVILNQLFGF